LLKWDDIILMFGSSSASF